MLHSHLHLALRWRSTIPSNPSFGLLTTYPILTICLWLQHGSFCPNQPPFPHPTPHPTIINYTKKKNWGLPFVSQPFSSSLPLLCPIKPPICPLHQIFLINFGFTESPIGIPLPFPSWIFSLHSFHTLANDCLRACCIHKHIKYSELWNLIVNSPWYFWNTFFFSNPWWKKPMFQSFCFCFQ